TAPPQGRIASSLLGVDGGDDGVGSVAVVSGVDDDLAACGELGVGQAGAADGREGGGCAAVEADDGEVGAVVEADDGAAVNSHQGASGAGGTGNGEPGTVLMRCSFVCRNSPGIICAPLWRTCVLGGASSAPLRRHHGV